MWTTGTCKVTNLTKGEDISNRISNSRVSLVENGLYEFIVTSSEDSRVSIVRYVQVRKNAAKFTIEGAVVPPYEEYNGDITIKFEGYTLEELKMGADEVLITDKQDKAIMAINIEELTAIDNTTFTYIIKATAEEQKIYVKSVIYGNNGKITDVSASDLITINPIN